MIYYEGATPPGTLSGGMQVVRCYRVDLQPIWRTRAKWGTRFSACRSPGILTRHGMCTFDVRLEEHDLEGDPSSDCRCRTRIAVALSLSLTPKAVGFDRRIAEVDFDAIDLPGTATLPVGVPGGTRHDGA